MHFLEFLSKNVDYDKQFMEFLSLIQKHGLSYAIPKISFLSPKTWTIICNFWNFFPFSKNMDYYMHFLELLSKNVDYDKQFMEFLSLLKKNGLSYAISKISSPSPKTYTILWNLWNFFPKTWTMISNLWNLFPFSKNVYYHKKFLKFLSFLQKRGLLYGIFGISIPSQKTWTIICIFWNFFPKTWTMISNLWNFFPFSRNMDYHMQFLKFRSLLKKRGLLYAIFGISFPSQKTWTIICIFWNFFPKTWTMINNLWNFFPFSKNMDYHMQFLKFLPHLQKRILSFGIYGISFPSQKRGLSEAVLEFLTLLQIPGLSYGIYG